MLVKNPPDDILVNRGAERQIDLIGDVRTSPGLGTAAIPGDSYVTSVDDSSGLRKIFRQDDGFFMSLKAL
jgi:hypothetical protein